METWSELKAQANKLFKKGEFAAAVGLYTQALALLPESERAGRISLLLNIVFSHIKLDSYIEACEVAVELLALDPTNTKAHYRLCSALVGAGLLAEAAQLVAIGVAHASLSQDKAELERLRPSEKDVASAAAERVDSWPARKRGVAESVRQCINRLRLMTPAAAAENATCAENGEEVSKDTRGADDSEMESEEVNARGTTDGTSTSAARVSATKPREDLIAEARIRGTDCYKAGDYISAIEHYTAALKLEPQSVALLGNRSAAALMIKRYDDVLVDCTTITNLDPSYTKAYSRMSKAHLGLSNIPDAIHWAREASGREPGSAALRQELAELQGLQRALEQATKALADGRHTTVLAVARGVMSRYPDLLLQPILLVLGEAQLKLGNTQEALSTGRKLLVGPGCHPKGPLLDFHARTLIATGNVQRAVSLYEQLYREDPDNVSAAKALKRVRTMLNGKEAGNAAFKAGDFEAAYKQYTRSLDVDPSLRTTFTAQVYANRSNVCLRLGRFQDAVADADLAIASDKAYGKAYLRKAQAQTKLGELEEAVRSYTQAQEVEPSMAGIAEMLEAAKVELKKSKRVDYYKLLEIDQNCGDADIKKAYRKAALKYHPDKVKAEDREQAEKDFKLLQEANAILTDSQKRARYDAGWATDEIENGFREGGPRGHHGCQHGFPTEEMLFHMFAGGGGGFRF